MKRFLLILISCLCVVGVVYLGYVVFQAKSIVSVEIEGTMQTLYLAGDDIDYEDAKLKVTYKNGTIKMISLDSSSVNVTMFSTSLEKHGTMYLNYKSYEIEVDYDVIQKGCYYVSEVETDSAVGGTSTKTYTIDDTSTILYLDGNNVLQYYTKANSKYYLYDGNYSDDYYYEIKGDTLYVYANDETYEIVANYDSDGNLSVEANEAETSKGYTTGNIKTTFTHYSMKTSRKITSLEIEYNQGTSYFTFNVGENIETSGQVIYAKVTYDDNTLLGTVYLIITDAMVSNSSLVTTWTTTVIYAKLYYEGYEFKLYYSVS